MSQDFTGVDPIKDHSAFIFSGPGGPFQCPTWPRWMFHATEAPRMVGSQADADALGEGWSDTYIKQDYPKAKFNQETGEFRAVANPEDEGKLEGSWGDKPPDKPTKEPAVREKTLQQVGEAVRDFRRLSLDYQQLNQDLDLKADNTAMQAIKREEVPHPQYHPSGGMTNKERAEEEARRKKEEGKK